MHLLEGIDGLRSLSPGGVMSIGNFDGIHRGHLRILDTAAEWRARTSGARLIVVTFEPHPLTVLRPNLAPPRLTPPAIKCQILESAGVDDLVVLAPTHDVLNLAAEEFFAILRDDAKPSHLVEGPNFYFGKNRLGTIGRLRQWTAASGMELHVVDAVQVPLLDLQIVDVSSSLIRWLLSYGRARDAAICLGRPYALQGVVVEGHRRGRAIGVPTANLRCEDQLVPADAVYAGRCNIDGTTYAAAVSIGTTPTFGEDARQVEAHLISFEGDLYGRTIQIELLDWLREQSKFLSVDALKVQISRDVESSRLRRSLPAEVPVASV
jgi:riboflavin kinase/FMN adenylyltransferase